MSAGWIDPLSAADNQRRFWSYIDRRGQDECWPWTGPVHEGRGHLRVGPTKTTATRHLMAHLMGRRLERTEYVCHSCDNPICMNPWHLFLGRQLDNIRDAAAKFRLNPGNHSDRWGVSFDTNRGRWQAHGYLEGRSIALGRYESESEAEAAVRDWRLAHGMELQP